MKRGKKNKTAKVISLIMTAMMLITSNSIVMASQITWQEEKNESIPGELNVESQNSSPVPELLGRVEENLESVGDITQGDIIKEETVQEVNEAEGNKAEAAEPAESLETQPQAVEIETENVFMAKFFIIFVYYQKKWSIFVLQSDVIKHTPHTN